MKTSHINIAILVALVVVVIGIGALFDSTTPASRTEEAPAFTITDLEGKTHSLQDYRGKIVILNFWATWCAPCIIEFPMLLDIASRHKDKVILLALSSDIKDDKIHEFIRKQKLPKDAANIIIARDTQDITGKLFHTYQIPETFVIDPEGAIRAKFTGAEWKQKELEGYIQ